MTIASVDGAMLATREVTIHDNRITCTRERIGRVFSFHFELVCHCRSLTTSARSSVLYVDVIDVVREARWCFKRKTRR